jgi:hypothetical protein
LPDHSRFETLKLTPLVDLMHGSYGLRFQVAL